ncbi:MAG: dihydroorotate dehydrogenase-like protein [Acidobacteriota bacterium]
MDTATSFLGLRLAHPFIAGASPLGFDLDAIKRLEDGGCSAIVIPSLFEEQITQAATGRIHHRDPLDDVWSATLAHFPDAADYTLTPDEYAAHIDRAKRSVAIPVIASLNGTSGESWLKFAHVVEQAGADALELNLYEVVTDLNVPGRTVEHQLLDAVTELKNVLTIPVSVKVSPFFAAFGNVAKQLDAAGADGLVMFNRFYQPDIDTATMKPVSRVSLSTSGELLLRLRWLAILYGRVRSSLVVTGGVQTPDDGIKALLAGADAVQVVSAILRQGPAHFKVLREGFEQWMEQHQFTQLSEVRGLASHVRTEDPAAFERAHYIRTLQSWND